MSETASISSNSFYESADENTAGRPTSAGPSHPYGQYSQGTDAQAFAQLAEGTRQGAPAPYSGPGDHRPDGYRDQLPEYSPLPQAGEIRLDPDAVARRPEAVAADVSAPQIVAAQAAMETRPVSEHPLPSYFNTVAPISAARNAAQAAASRSATNSTHPLPTTSNAAVAAARAVSARTRPRQVGLSSAAAHGSDDTTAGRGGAEELHGTRFISR